METHKGEWEAASDSIQYMGSGSRHELNALAITEATVHAIKNLRSPIFLTFLVKEAAFDSALKDHIIKKTLMAANSRSTQYILYMA